MCMSALCQSATHPNQCKHVYHINKEDRSTFCLIHHTRTRYTHSCSRNYNTEKPAYRKRSSWRQGRASQTSADVPSKTAASCQSQFYASGTAQTSLFCSCYISAFQVQCYPNITDNNLHENSSPHNWYRHSNVTRLIQRFDCYHNTFRELDTIATDSGRVIHQSATDGAIGRQHNTDSRSFYRSSYTNLTTSDTPNSFLLISYTQQQRSKQLITGRISQLAKKAANLGQELTSFYM